MPERQMRDAALAKRLDGGPETIDEWWKEEGANQLVKRWLQELEAG